MTQTLALPVDVRLMGWAANAMYAVALLMALAALAHWVARHPVWTLQRITVVGDVEHQNAATLQAHLRSSMEGSFLTLDLLEVQRLFEEVPWVRQAVVQRDFPQGLRVTLQEHEAAAWWGTSGSRELINRDGEVFEAHAQGVQSDGWSELMGPYDRSQQVYALYRLLVPVFAGMERKLVRLELNARGSWMVKLDGGTRIELGRGDAQTLLERAQNFTRTVPILLQQYGQRDIESADLRYPNGYALRLRGVTTLDKDRLAPPVVQNRAVSAAQPSSR